MLPSRKIQKVQKHCGSTTRNRSDCNVIRTRTSPSYFAQTMVFQTFSVFFSATSVVSSSSTWSSSCPKSYFLYCTHSTSAFILGLKVRLCIFVSHLFTLTALNPLHGQLTLEFSPVARYMTDHPRTLCFDLMWLHLAPMWRTWMRHVQSQICSQRNVHASWIKPRFHHLGTSFPTAGQLLGRSPSVMQRDTVSGFVAELTVSGSVAELNLRKRASTRYLHAAAQADGHSLGSEES